MLEVPGPNGRIAHAEMSFGDGVIMLSSARREQGWRSPRDLGGINQAQHISVDDLEAHYARAKVAGVEIAEEIADTDYGSRAYSARDLEGHWWTFGTYRPAP